MHGPVLISPSRPVKQVDGDWIHQGYRLFPPFLNLLHDDIAGPFGIALQDVFRQLNRFLYPYTSGAEGAFGLLKQFSRRRIMKVNVESVGEHELDTP